MCPQCHQERPSQPTSRVPEFHRSTHQIHHRSPRNRWTPLPRYPDQTHSLTPLNPQSTENPPTQIGTWTMPFQQNYLLSTFSSTELNNYVLHLNSLQRKWFTFMKSYKTTTTQHSSFNKANPNRKPTKSKTHPQESL